jgi:hypothetical protein
MFKYLFVILLLTSSAAHGANSDFLPMLEQAKQLMKYNKEIKLPIMVPKTEKQLKQIFCPGQDCSVSAIYSDGTVYYDKRIDYKNNIIDRSIIIHEMIHHIQAKKHGLTYECDMWYHKERQAYRLQAQFLRANGINASFVNDVTASLKCPK